MEDRQIQGQTVRSEVGWKTDTGTDRDRHMHVLTVAYLYRDGREEEADTDKQTDRQRRRTHVFTVPVQRREGGRIRQWQRHASTYLLYLCRF